MLYEVITITHVNGAEITVGSPIVVLHGTVALVESAGQPDQLRFTPTAEYNGEQSFTYTISNMDGNTDTATVTVTIASVNDNPIAVDDAATTNEDTAVTFDIIGNDSDVDIATNGDSISILQSEITGVAHGTISLTGGDLTYTPDADFNGTETLTYTLRDENGGSDTATITITVTPVDDNPTAVDDLTVTTDEDNAVTIPVLTNDSDTDSDPALNFGGEINDGVVITSYSIHYTKLYELTL